MIMLVRSLTALLVCASCGTPEPAISPPPKPSTILSTFTPLKDGFSQAIAPGAPLVTLGAGATWWDGDVPVTVALPQNGTPYGSRWKPDGTSLCLGLGALDLAARTWRPEPGLQAFNRPGPDRGYPVRQVAWFADTSHVAMVIEARATPGTRTQEIVTASADGHVRGRHRVAGMVTAMVASDDRVLVGASKMVVLDLDAKVIAEPALSVLRVSEGGGMFAATLTARGVALLRPSDGAVLATWDVPANDAVPVPHGVVAVDFEGTVRVGCLDGGVVREVANVASGTRAPIIQRVGDRIVVAGSDANPIRVATFTNPCH